MQFSDCLKNLRKKSFLTQEEFAKEIGVAPTTVNRWENGKANPNLSAMRTIKAYCASHNQCYDDLERCWLNEDE